MLLGVAYGESPYHEAPMLAELVRAGKLPPVEERLPENPVVVEPVHSIGKYGGDWHRFTLGARDLLLRSRMGYEPLVRWDRTGKNVEPGLAESWEILDGGRTYVFHLRKGLKWSDGAQLTSEDVLFQFEDVFGSKEVTPIYPSWLELDGVPFKITAPDPHTVVFELVRPYGIFLEVMAYRSVHMLAPKHYLKQFHARYADEEALNKQAKEHGFNLWGDYFFDLAFLNHNPDLPTWKPWKLTVPPPSMRMVAERNPYYWKVDPEGNQLPYIDRVVYTSVENNEVVTIKAMAGETEFQARRIDASNYSLFMENRERGNYRVLRDPAPDTAALFLNQHSKDPAIRELLKDRRFRIALSLAINREELIFILYAGMAQASRGVASPYDPYYRPEYNEKYIEYDPDRANALLDEIGMQRGRNGMRRMPDGTPFRQILHVFPSEAGTSTDLWQLVGDYFREVGLDFTVVMDAVTLSVLQVRNGNSDFWAYSMPGMHWIVDPLWYVPWQDTTYFAPAYGRYIDTNGLDKLGAKPPPEYQRLTDWYIEFTGVVGDKARQRALAHRILGQWAEECYIIGTCRQELLTIVSNDFKNVPDTIIHDWRIQTPGYIGIEQFYIDPTGVDE